MVAPDLFRCGAFTARGGAVGPVFRRGATIMEDLRLRGWGGVDRPRAEWSDLPPGQPVLLRTHDPLADVRRSVRSAPGVHRGRAAAVAGPDGAGAVRRLGPLGGLPDLGRIFR